MSNLLIESLKCENQKLDNKVNKLTQINLNLLEALKMAIKSLEDNNIDEMMAGEFEILTDAIKQTEKI